MSEDNNTENTGAEKEEATVEATSDAAAETPLPEKKPVKKAPKKAAKKAPKKVAKKAVKKTVKKPAQTTEDEVKVAKPVKEKAVEAKPAGEKKAEAPIKKETKGPKEKKTAEASETPKKEKSGAEKNSEGEEESDESRSKAPSAADLLKDDLGEVKIRKAKGSKNIYSGVVHVLATFNNTRVTFTDVQGNVISWSSAGKCNFRGSRKSTAYAAQVVTQDAGRTAMSHGLREVEIRVKGPGMGRDSAIRAVQALGLTVTAIVDVTPVPHNGCRPPKRRRV